MAHVVQLEWIFLQCMTNEMANDFTGLGKALQETFLPETLLKIVGALSTFLTNKSRMGLQNPVMSE